MALKIRIVTSFGGWFDMDRTEDFSMSAFVTSVRAMGYALNDTLYVPHEHIATIFTFDTEAMQDVPAPGSMPSKPEGTLQ